MVIYIYFSCDCNNLKKGVASGIHGKKTERRTNISDGEGLFDSRVNRSPGGDDRMCPTFKQ